MTAFSSQGRVDGVAEAENGPREDGGGLVEFVAQRGDGAGSMRRT
jgi:hypothetical protein